MTREKFIKILETNFVRLDKASNLLRAEDFTYDIVGERIVLKGSFTIIVSGEGIDERFYAEARAGRLESTVFILSSELPDGLVFSNKGNVRIQGLKNLPNDLSFKNVGDVTIINMRSLTSRIGFANRGNVDLDTIKSISSGVVFSNKGDVVILPFKEAHPDVSFRNDGDVIAKILIRVGMKGIIQKMLLNSMIKAGIFSKSSL